MRTRVNRYAAKLLFQFRVGRGRWSKRRICETRIIVLKARSAKTALLAAKRAGKEGEFSYVNDEGWRVHFEFVGVLDLLHLGPECTADEVWYEVNQMLRPMERKRRLIPADSVLVARA